ncbi:MAG TPA: protein kinase [Thermoanaerobaculia bacterium]|nr:protein kinase [Thermoanaerobaculia bacterium]
MSLLAAGRRLEIGGLRLEVVRLLATGASAHVYLARGDASGEAVGEDGRCVLKVFLPPSRLGPGAEPVTAAGLAAARTLQRREAGRLARLDHPNVVRLLGVGRLELSPEERMLAPGLAPVVHLPALCLSHVEGVPLLLAFDLLDLAPEQILHALSRVADALAHIHERRVLHNDVKSDNVLVRRADLEPVLVDFGGAGRSRSRDLVQLGELIAAVSVQAVHRLEPVAAAELTACAAALRSNREGSSGGPWWSAERAAGALARLVAPEESAGSC